MLTLPLLRTLNTLVALPYIYVHAILVIVLAIDPKSYGLLMPEMVDMTRWGWWGWMLLNLFILAFVVLQYHSSTARIHGVRVRTTFALVMVYELALALCWRTHAYPAALIFSLLSTLALGSLYFELHFSARAKVCEDGVELMGVWMLVSAWLPWSLYLSLFTLFQAVPDLRDDRGKKHKHHSSSGASISAELVAGLGLALLALSSLFFSLRTRRRPAGDPIASFFTAWILWAVFFHQFTTFDAPGGKKRSKERLGLAWTGVMAGVATLGWMWSGWSTYEAIEANRLTIGFDDDATWRRPALREVREEEPEVNGKRTRLLSV